MAGYRQFHTQFWKDEWAIELKPVERYLYIYLFTNDLSSISGIYKLPLRVICNETGLDADYVTPTLNRFQQDKKIFYRDGVMWVVNMRKYHKNASPRTMTKVNADVMDIPDGDVKEAYLYYQETGIYSMDIVSIPRSERLSVSVKESVSENKEGGIRTSDFGTLATRYEQNIGALSQRIGEMLKDDLEEYGLTLCLDAIDEAVRQNRRAWSYAQGILKNWYREGRTNGKKKETLSGPVKIVLSDGSIQEATA